MLNVISKYKDFILLQIAILFYSFVTFFAKVASNYSFLSIYFFKYVAIMLLILGIYACIWQKTLKSYQLSNAYANRAFSLVWTLVWAVLFFNETVTVNNILGVSLIILGITLVVKDDK